MLARWGHGDTWKVIDAPGDGSFLTVKLPGGNILYCNAASVYISISGFPSKFFRLRCSIDHLKDILPGDDRKHCQRLGLFRTNAVLGHWQFPDAAEVPGKGNEQEFTQAIRVLNLVVATLLRCADALQSRLAGVAEHLRGQCAASWLKVGCFFSDLGLACFAKV